MKLLPQKIEHQKDYYLENDSIFHKKKVLLTVNNLSICLKHLEKFLRQRMKCKIEYFNYEPWFQCKELIFNVNFISPLMKDNLFFKIGRQKITFHCQEIKAGCEYNIWEVSVSSHFDCPSDYEKSNFIYVRMKYRPEYKSFDIMEK